MRDDLHKRAPIPRKAQSVLKMALREADRAHPERLRIAARATLEEVLTQGFSEPTLRKLAGDAHQWQLFSDSEAPQQAQSPAEAEVLAGLSQCETADSRLTLLQSALASEIDSYAREARATMIAEGARDIAQTINAFSAALHEAAAEVAESRCVAPIPPAPAPPLTLGENLLGPGRGGVQ